MSNADRQLPRGDEIFLDHVGHFVRDPEAARRALARAGFAPTPTSIQVNSDPAGGVVLLHDGFADQGDGVDDVPPPLLDRIALTRSVLDEIGSAGLVGRSLGDALVQVEPELRPWLEELGDPT